MICPHIWVSTGRLDITLDGNEHWAWFKCTACGEDGFQVRYEDTDFLSAVTKHEHHTKIIE
jgi:hypothetical protein